MNILITIDDTDNRESPGTGHLAEKLRHELEALFGAATSRITRHQLYVHEDIPYTSHNSAMTFAAVIDEKLLDDIIRHCSAFLEKEPAAGSDPGLCVAVVDAIPDRRALIDFGLDATKKVLTKREAYALAARLGIHLSEHGGTGGGVIGALAGTGLRLYGNNGRFKGWLPFDDMERDTTVGVLLQRPEIDAVKSLEEPQPGVNDRVMLQDKVKTVLIGGRSVLLVKIRSGASDTWENLSKEEIRKY
jgi:hypothetical protein